MALPGVTERLSWGQPAWFVKTLLALIWEQGVLTVKTDDRDLLVAADPQAFYWTRHHAHSRELVLVRLDHIDKPELRKLLLNSYRLAGGQPPARRQTTNNSATRIRPQFRITEYI
jgi:hypothetical protein